MNLDDGDTERTPLDDLPLDWDPAYDPLPDELKQHVPKATLHAMEEERAAKAAAKMVKGVDYNQFVRDAERERIRAKLERIEQKRRRKLQQRGRKQATKKHEL
ncbi:unnamed protein product [Amoebophrya sp. A120]|nr:unnamed protein product [Amoebophrya sp. A120]|eukprot:GSA120T00011040001.1